MKKKLLSIMLALCIMLTALAAPAAATAGDTGTYKPYPEATYELKYTENTDGPLTITGYTGMARGELRLPEQIDGKAVTTIGMRAFSDCSGLTDVYYSGSEEQWNAIQILNGNDPLLNVAIHFNSTGPGSAQTVTPAGASPEVQLGAGIDAADKTVVETAAAKTEVTGLEDTAVRQAAEKFSAEGKQRQAASAGRDQ